MFSSKWVAPALIFFAGAVVGRVLGLKPLLRGAMTVATLAGVGEAPSHARAPGRKIVHRPARRRAAVRRSRAA